jgi:glucosylceramidase
VENGTHKVTRSGQYWAFAHYSRHVKRGARAFATNAIGNSGAASAVSQAGFRNPDGSHIIVIANTGAANRVQLVQGSQALNLDLPADSVQTLQWS